MKHALPCLLLAASALAWPGLSRSETFHACTGFIDSLPAVIATQGTWCLRRDLSTAVASGNAITIATNNVTIDCNGYKIGGLAAGTGTNVAGIHAHDRMNATVRRCSIRGFAWGIRLWFGGGYLVEHNQLQLQTIGGIGVVGAGSMVRDNRVADTGGSSTHMHEVFGIYALDGVDVLDNTINGVVPSSTSAYAYGIHTADNGDGTVSDNRVREVSSGGTGKSFGIASSFSPGQVLHGNHLQGSGVGVAGGVGIYCSDSRESAHANVITGFQIAIDNCLSSSNHVNPN